MDTEKRKEQKRIAAKIYREKHPDLVKQRNKEQYEKNKETRISYSKEYYLKNIEKIKDKDKQRYEVTKELQNKRYKDFRKNNPDYVREQDKKYWLKKKYGLTVEQFAEMWVFQNGKCANTRCSTLLFRGKGGFGVDHCHSTGKVRGLLCMKCNISLGNLEDSIPKLIGLIFYLKNHGQQ
jgi:hypothetical protein